MGIIQIACNLLVPVYKLFVPYQVVSFLEAADIQQQAKVTYVFMITNDCPDEAPNMEWCAQAGGPKRGHGNTHGYEVHFDLENFGQQITNIGWDNPEVTWEYSSCSGCCTNH